MDTSMSAPSPPESDQVLVGQEKKGPWSPEEDERLKDAVGSSSPRPKWAEVASKVEGRSAKQCRERWEQNLSPRLNKSPISRQEGQFIISFVDEQGKKWAEIARQLTNRSDNNIKNWYNGMVQKGKTGRGPQDDGLRYHFTPDHQNYLANRGRTSMQRASPIEARHPHLYHPYGAPRASYPPPHHHHSGHAAGYQYTSAPYHQHASPYDGPQVPSSYGQLPTTPLPTPGIGGSRTSLPPMQPSPPIKLAPLQTPDPRPTSIFTSYNKLMGSYQLQQEQKQQRPEMRDYFENPGWHSRNLTVQTIGHQHAHDNRRVSAVSPMSHGSDESHDVPMLSASTSSTPMHGSPLTPALHQNDVYRHRAASNESHSMDHERELPSKPEATSGAPTGAPRGQKISISALCN